MFRPFTTPIEDIAIVFGHERSLSNGEKRIYSVAALRISKDATITEFASNIRSEKLRAREYTHSQLSEAKLKNAPDEITVSGHLQDFLEGIEHVVGYVPNGHIISLEPLCNNERIIDAALLADYFMPWTGAATAKSLWEYLHKQERQKISFTALEGAGICVDLLQHLFGTVLNDTSFPAASALRYYLGTSNTLFGTFCCHVLEHYSSYFGNALITPVSKPETADWEQFLDTAPKKEKITVEREAYQELPEDDIQQLYEQLAHKRKGYTVRQPQVDYASHIAHAINSNAVACIEAGTGTGKTLGYLLPVMEFLKRNPSQRVAIATYTKSLQKQLFGNELDSCRELFGQYNDIPVSLIKGKSNYVCAQKLNDILSPLLDGIELLSWLYFANICYHYRIADLDDVTPRLRAYFDEGRTLSNIAQEVSAGSGCFSTHKRCPGNIVTAEAAQSRLVITNHNKLVLMESDPLLSDLFKHCVIDEANHFEDAVRTTLSPEVSTSDIFFYCRYLREQCRKLILAPSTTEAVENQAEAVVSEIAYTVTKIGALRDQFKQMNQGAAFGAVPVTPAHKAFTEGDAAKDLAILNKHLERISEFSAFFTGKKAGDLPLGYKTISRCRTMRTLLQEISVNLMLIRKGLHEDGTWNSIHVFPRNWILCGGQVYMGAFIRETIIKQRDTVILTSATLTHQSSFTPYRRTLGLGKADILKFSDEEAPPKPCFVARVAPPFTPDYSLVVPSDAPSALYEHKKLWLEYTLNVLPKLIEYNDGATLVLCASYEDLEALRKNLEATYDGSYPLLFQRKGEPATALIEEFRTTRESVLFGVETFWHGVDFPGKTLTQVVITRLPFPAPNSPLMDARKRFLPDGVFWERYRYETAIKFRQGAGRLIRRETDSGLVVVLDNRLLKNQRLSPCQVIQGMRNVPEHHRGKGWKTIE
ncbi:ATP-dependent DNA helicase [Halodesulfovibrio sp. MK-HDV]|uniref:ATP-dependent DNA helicase n=1 Tax=Halodesulfovibrio sp. MK-HDV TaxID=2599925 RepID=UPI00136BC343|nr:ATP-dependent DNA helicase [Halodesulfovibrio sp. MK-HDV]KAF1077323.1 putative ATP-dependent helicase DinG [Halodesulfovibrio sp. MK-HDV]